MRPTGVDLALWQTLQKEGRPMHSEELEQKLGMRGTQVRESVNRLVNAGYPIGSNTLRGYFVIGDELEWRRAMGDLDSRIKELHARRNSLFEYGNKRGWREVTQPEFSFGPQAL